MEETSWFDKPRYRNVKRSEETLVPQKNWSKCGSCNREETSSELEKNLFVCSGCGFHFPINHRQRIALLLDPGSFRENFKTIKTVDPLKFHDGKQSYKEKIDAVVQRTGLRESVVVGEGRLKGKRVALGVMEFGFIGGSMGAATGHKIFSLMKQAAKKEIPLILSASSGGARMQEGLLSLVQMAKTSLGVKLLSEKKVPFLSLLTHPTAGGVTASFASLGDVIIAEPGATIAFSGRRVIEETGGESLPENFQTAEFVQQCGFVDHLVSRQALRETISQLLTFFEN